MTQHQSNRIQRVVIVGGGSAGWMAALHLQRFFRRLGGSVVLVESPVIGTIGVGEATIPTLVQFIRRLKLDESELLRRCSGTYKLGIKFEDWVRPGQSYWHPFGLCGGVRINSLDIFHYWLKRRLEVGSKVPYTAFSAQAMLSEEGKAPWPYGSSSRIYDAGGYAYHIDAGAFGDYMREIATGEGVEHVFGTVQEVEFDDRGHIDKIHIGGERTLSGDLFIDATGFSGRLIEKAVGDPWIDWSKYMLGDAAVALPLPRDEQFPPYTLSRALPAGWMWRIALNNRTGSGYVYSSTHVSQEAATAALIAQSGLRKTRAADPRHIRMRVGRRTRFWSGNCVAVGLAAGFVEPLESTGIHLAQKALTLLTDYMPDRNFDDGLRKAYNERMTASFDEVRDFIMLHYLLSQRDEPFWRDARNVPLPDTLQESLALYDENGRLELPRFELFPETSYYYILSGNERLPRRPVIEADAAAASDTWHLLDGLREETRRFVAGMPLHANYLAQLHRTAP